MSLSLTTIVPVLETDVELQKMDKELQKLFIQNGNIDAQVVKNLANANIRTIGLYHLLGDEQSTATSQTNLGRSRFHGEGYGEEGMIR